MFPNKDERLLNCRTHTARRGLFAAGSSPRQGSASAKAGAVLFSFLLSFALVAASAFPLAAFADDSVQETSSLGSDPTAALTDEMDELTAQIEATGTALNEANARVSEIEARIAENEEQLSTLYNQIPTQLQRSADAVRELYKMQHQSTSLIELLLNADNFADFIVNFQYVTHIQQRHLDTVAKLREMKQQLDDTQAQLAQDRADALVEQASAQEALAAAQAARQEAQRRAQEEAERQAAAEAARLEAERRAAAEAERAAQEEADRKAQEEGGNEPADETEEGNGSDAEIPDAPVDSTGPSEETPDDTVSGPGSDGADWSTDKEAFVSTWAPRIDAFMAGSPMAGTGTIFAEAAWDYGVDPRFSPAIANTESSRGAACFLPYHAWGWGSASWGSWDEAIRAHVAGLAAGYGYTITEAGAQKYCPPNWQEWYNRTSAAMALI